MSICHELSAGSPNLSWHVSERILFRFSFCYIVLYYVPYVLGAVPGTVLLVNWFSHSWILLVYGMVGVPAPLQPTGSGDTFSAYILQLVILVLALVMGLTWSIFDRRSGSYIRLHGWLRLLARYALAFALLPYAFSKVIPTQFIHLQNSQLAESYGRSSPMGLLWKFMGYSTTYTFLGGCAELLPACLLLFRRTALLGSLLAFAVMLNGVMLNFCYDVPVKLYSLLLLLLSIFLVLPDTSRLYRIFILNASVQPIKSVGTGSQPQFRTKNSTRVEIHGSGNISGSNRCFIGQSISRGGGSNRTICISPHNEGLHWIQEEPYNR